MCISKRCWMYSICETVNWVVRYRGWFVFENYYTKLPLRNEANDPVDLLRKDIQTLKRALTNS